ncbi:MAG: T9SS type A sorting domain-containing protein, partial [Saprospiraceae bacterium]
ELNSCQIESISSAALEIEEEHYLIDDGRLKIAYTTDRAKIVQKGDILFYIRLKEDRKNVSLYSIRQEEFKSEFYDQELKAHVLILDDEENKNTFLISSVEKDGQQIKLKIHSENLQEVSLRIYNIQGILLAQSKRNLADGSQEIQIPCGDFNTGVFLIQCENTNQSQIIKLIN